MLKRLHGGLKAELSYWLRDAIKTFHCCPPSRCEDKTPTRCVLEKNQKSVWKNNIFFLKTVIKLSLMILHWKKLNIKKSYSDTCVSGLDLHEQDHGQGITMLQVTRISSVTRVGTWGHSVVGLFQHLWLVGLRTQAASMPLGHVCADCQHCLQGWSVWEHWEIFLELVPSVLSQQWQMAVALEFCLWLSTSKAKEI